MHSKTVCTVISILERTIVHTNIQKFDWKTVQGAGIITSLVQHRWVTVIPVHRWVTVHCAHVGHCAVCTGHMWVTVQCAQVTGKLQSVSSMCFSMQSRRQVWCTLGRGFCRTVCRCIIALSVAISAIAAVQEGPLQSRHS